MKFHAILLHSALAVIHPFAQCILPITQLVALWVSKSTVFIHTTVHVFG